MAAEAPTYQHEYMKGPMTDESWANMREEFKSLDIRLPEESRLQPFYLKGIPDHAARVRLLISHKVQVTPAIATVHRETGDMGIAMNAMESSGRVQHLQINTNVQSGLQSVSLTGATYSEWESAIHVVTDDRKRELSRGEGIIGGVLRGMETKIIVLFAHESAYTPYSRFGEAKPRIFQFARYHYGVDNQDRVRAAFMHATHGVSRPGHPESKIAANVHLVSWHGSPLFLWVTPGINASYEVVHEVSGNFAVCLAKKGGTGGQVIRVTRSDHSLGMEYGKQQDGQFRDYDTVYQPGELPQVVHRGNTLYVGHAQISPGIPVIFQDCAVSVGGDQLSAMVLHDDELTALVR